MYYYKKKSLSDKLPKNLKCRGCMIFYDKSEMENKSYCKDCYLFKYNKKRCTKCELLRDSSDFKKDKECRGGYRPICNVCKKGNLKYNKDIDSKKEQI